jgi:ankyrin repeat protein
MDNNIKKLETLYNNDILTEEEFQEKKELIITDKSKSEENINEESEKEFIENKILIQDKLIEETKSDYILAPLNVKNNKEKLIFINGFLTEKNDGQVWDAFYNNLEEEIDSYHYRWKAGTVGKMIKGIIEELSSIVNVAEIARKIEEDDTEKDIGPILKQWKDGKDNAKKAGEELGKYIYNSDNQFTLVGHSLGTVVIYNALLYLIENNSLDKIKSVNLLGGAIQTENYELLLAKYNNLNINNYYSKKDLVLLVLFNIAESILNLKIDKNSFWGSFIGIVTGGILAALNLIALPGTIALAIAGGAISSLIKSFKEISFGNPLGRNIIKNSYARNINSRLKHIDYVNKFEHIFKGFVYQKRLEEADILDIYIEDSNELIENKIKSNSVIRLNDGIYENRSIIINNKENLTFVTDGNIVFKDSIFILNNCKNVNFEYCIFLVGDENGKKERKKFIEINNSTNVKFYGNKFTNQDIEISKDSQVEFIETNFIGENYDLELCNGKVDFNYCNFLGAENTITSNKMELNFLDCNFKSTSQLINSKNDKIDFKNSIFDSSSDFLDSKKSSISIIDSFIHSTKENLIFATDTDIDINNNTILNTENNLFLCNNSDLNLSNNFIKNNEENLIKLGNSKANILENEFINSTESIISGDTLRKIGVEKNTFNNCNNIIEIENTPKIKIKENEFSDSEQILSIKASSAEIGNNKFTNNKEISVEINNSNVNLRSNIFDKDEIPIVLMKNSISEVIGNEFLSNDSSLISIDSEFKSNDNLFKNSNKAIYSINSKNHIDKNTFKENKFALEIRINSLGNLDSNEFIDNKINCYIFNSDIKIDNQKDSDILIEDIRKKEKMFSYSFIELAEGLNFENSSRYYLKDIPEEKINQSKDKYIDLDYDEEILFLYAGTMLSSAKSGIAITKRHLYFSDPRKKTIEKKIRIDKIEDIEINKSEVLINLINNKEVSYEIKYCSKKKNYYLELLLKRCLFNRNPLTNLRKEIEKLYGSYGEIPFGDEIQIFSNIDSEKLNNAIENYAQNVEKKNVLLLEDETILQNGKKGFLLTNNYLHYYKSAPISLNNAEVTNEESYRINLNNNSVKYSMPSNKDDFIDFLNDFIYIKYLKDLFAVKIECLNCNSIIKSNQEFCSNCGVDLINYFASNSQDVDTIEILVSENDNINEKDEKGNTPLINAAKNNSDPNIINSLYNLGADISVSNYEGQTPLIFAVKNNKKEVIEELINLNANINIKDGNKLTPLIHAVIEDRDLEIIDYLIDMGADVNAIS